MRPTAKMPSQKGDRQYHIACRKGDLAPYVLLPGDPGRVPKIAEFWEERKEVAWHREYRSMTGLFKGVKISCLSTGIGAPSTAIAVEEAARIGVRTFIRVGSTGALQARIKPGDLVISVGGVKFEGTSKNYVWPEYPALAHYEVVLALIEACEKLKLKYHLGITASTDSFYVGEGRPGLGGYNQSYLENILSDLQKAKVLNIEMESSALFTIANLYNLRAGAICAVFDNLITNEFVIRGEKEMALVASEAMAILAEWDRLKRKNQKRYFYPSLIEKIK